MRAPAPPAGDHARVTLVIPARSSPEPLRELLQLLPADLPVVIVDDGSSAPLAGLATEWPGVQVCGTTVLAGRQRLAMLGRRWLLRPGSHFSTPTPCRTRTGSPP